MDELFTFPVNGTPWSEEEHRMFLLGLQQLGKGDWRGIARSYVVSRTPTQVASHAQKYFIRQTNSSRRKRRSSLFDMVADESAVHRDFLSFDHQHEELQGSSRLPTPQNDNRNLLTAPALDEECESMDSTKSNDVDSLPPKPDISQLSYYPIVYPAYVSPFYPFAVPFWSGSDNSEEVETKKEMHEILKPTAVHSKSPINVDELVGMSKLSLGEPIGHSAPSSLSLKLLEGSSRQSAFHANPGSGSSSMNTSSSPIHAV